MIMRWKAKLLWKQEERYYTYGLLLNNEWGCLELSEEPAWRAVRVLNKLQTDASRVNPGFTLPVAAQTCKLAQALDVIQPSSREGLGSTVRQLGAGSGSPGPVALQGLYSPRNILNKIFLYNNTISCSLKLHLEMYSLGLTFTLSCPTYWVLPSQLQRETQFSKCRLRGITLGSCFGWSLHGYPHFYTWHLGKYTFLDLK